MIDTTLIGVLAAAAVVVVLLLLFLRRQNAPKFNLQDEEDTPPQIDETSSAESISTVVERGRTSAAADQADRAEKELESASVVAEPPRASGASVGKGKVAAGADGSATPSGQVGSGTQDVELSGDGAPAPHDARQSIDEDAHRDAPDATGSASSGAPKGDAEADDGAQDNAEQESIGALKQGLKSTRGGFIARLAKLFKGKTKVDSALLDEFEEILITADVGVKTSERLLQALKARASDGNIEGDDALWAVLRAEAKQILHVDAPPIALSHKPSLILVTGVNGVGKTTTIGKLAAKYTAEGRRVLLAAGDTYRAAAVLQLEVWGQRVGCPVIKGKEGADPGSVIFDAITRAREERYDLVIADTAGRLHTKQPLMEELKKVDRTITKALGGRAADEILLVLDATTGQNAVQQMHMFRDALDISGVVLTKLDGTAKGGVILGIVDEHKVPVRFVGLGERVEDLREFEADAFVAALFERPSGETLAA